MEVLPGHAFLPLSPNLSARVTRVSSLHLYFTTLSHKGEGSSCLRRFYNVWQKPMWQVNIFVRWLRKDISAGEWGPPTRECGKYFSPSREKGENVQASVSEWGVSSWAWVLFLYSTRNKRFLYTSQMVSHSEHSSCAVLISTAMQQKSENNLADEQEL